MLNPGIQTVVRTHSEGEADLLRAEHAGAVFLGEHELARSMARHVVAAFAEAPARASVPEGARH